MHDLLPVICWHLYEASQDVRFVAWYLLVSVRGMTRCAICCLRFSSFCGRHGKIHDLLSKISYQDKEIVALTSCLFKPKTLHPKP